ncbi:MAG: ATP-binding protein, partial [Candidatus Fonsibacter sp.]
AVADQGSGLPESVKNGLFQPFMTHKKDGTGLGLWISRSIVERYGGNIRAYCGPTKIKLHPSKSSAEVLTLITTQDDQRAQFLNFGNTMIAEYQAGNKQAKVHREVVSGARVGLH